MPTGLQRRYGQRHLHFITGSCYRRLPLLRPVRARNLFVENHYSPSRLEADDVVFERKLHFATNGWRVRFG